MATSIGRYCCLRLSGRNLRLVDLFQTPGTCHRTIQARLRTTLHIQSHPFLDWHYHDERRYDSCHHGEPYVPSVIRHSHTPFDRVWPVGGRGLHDGLRHMPRRDTLGAFSLRGHVSYALSSRICKQVSHAGNDGLSTISMFPPARICR
jgi:hypothetical protein